MDQFSRDIGKGWAALDAPSFCNTPLTSLLKTGLWMVYHFSRDIGECGKLDGWVGKTLNTPSFFNTPHESFLVRVVDDVLILKGHG